MTKIAGSPFGSGSRRHRGVRGQKNTHKVKATAGGFITVRMLPAPGWDAMLTAYSAGGDPAKGSIMRKPQCTAGTVRGPSGGLPSYPLELVLHRAGTLNGAGSPTKSAEPPCAAFTADSTQMSQSSDSTRGGPGAHGGRHNAEQWLAAIVESSSDAIVAKDLDGIVTSWNRGAERLFGYNAAEIVGRPVATLIPQDRADEETAILTKIRKGEPVEPYETVRRRRDGSIVDVLLAVSPVKDAEGRLIGASKIARDNSERKRAQERQELLIREMNHRIRNLFAIVDGIIMVSARRFDKVDEFADAVRQRIDALSRAHGLILPEEQHAHRGADGSIQLGALIETILSPFVSSATGLGDRVRLRGCDVNLSQATATSLALLFYEFATNASKYGALSVPGGRVAIDCRDDGDKLVLTWSEKGSPLIEKVPPQGGFGTRLTRATVENQLRGTVVYDWTADGVSIRLEIPTARLAD